MGDSKGQLQKKTEHNEKLGGGKVSKCHFDRSSCVWFNENEWNRLQKNEKYIRKRSIRKNAFGAFEMNGGLSLPLLSFIEKCEATSWRQLDTKLQQTNITKKNEIYNKPPRSQVKWQESVHSKTHSESKEWPSEKSSGVRPIKAKRTIRPVEDD